MRGLIYTHERRRNAETRLVTIYMVQCGRRSICLWLAVDDDHDDDDDDGIFNFSGLHHQPVMRAIGMRICLISHTPHVR